MKNREVVIHVFFQEDVGQLWGHEPCAPPVRLPAVCLVLVLIVNMDSYPPYCIVEFAGNFSFILRYI